MSELRKFGLKVLLESQAAEITRLRAICQAMMASAVALRADWENRYKVAFAEGTDPDQCRRCAASINVLNQVIEKLESLSPLEVEPGEELSHEQAIAAIDRRAEQTPNVLKAIIDASAPEVEQPKPDFIPARNDREQQQRHLHGDSSRIDDGTKCAESMNGEHCGHYYYEWHPKDDGDHGEHKGPHCCYCDSEPLWFLSAPEVEQREGKE
jgi:hypothetical protein